MNLAKLYVERIKNVVYYITYDIAQTDMSYPDKIKYLSQYQNTQLLLIRLGLSEDDLFDAQRMQEFNFEELKFEVENEAISTPLLNQSQFVTSSPRQLSD